RQHLFGWPIGIAALFLLLLIVPASLQGLSTFLIVVATSGVCCAAGVDLLRIYERRVTHLSKIETDHAKIVAVDAKFLCDSLRDLRGRACAVWLVEREPHFTYSFFETVDEHRVFGVIKSVDDPHFVYWLWEWASDGSFAGATKTVDDRKISDAERITLWGEKKNA
ncbi:MAG TPA: hypothetical protein VG838_14835, partial [Opitutaceae bacterium]|nr:hypothetical protein [Opitutaceae bacterium]